MSQDKPDIVIRLIPERLANPDADLRYDLPDLIQRLTNGAATDNGYGPNDEMYVFLRWDGAESTMAAVLRVLETERLHGNDLAVAATVAVGRHPRYRTVFPEGEGGELLVEDSA